MKAGGACVTVKINCNEHLGLGLNISKILSERHGGNIQIANNKAGGACVTVKINCNES